MSENMSIDELRAQLDVAEERWAHFETKCILLERQADDMNGLFLRFRALFGKDATPEAIQERLERAATLKTAAEQQCERVRQTKIDQSPLVVALFTEHLQLYGSGSTWEKRVRAAIAGTQQAMRMIADAGGLGDLQASEVTVDLLKDEIGGLRQRIAAEDVAARENHECLSKIIGERTAELDERTRALGELANDMTWLVMTLRGQIDEFERRTQVGHEGYTIAPTVCAALRGTLDRWHLNPSKSESASGGEQPAGDDPDRPADPSTPGAPTDPPGSEEGAVLPPEADEDVPF